jgi:hypothetical protein
VHCMVYTTEFYPVVAMCPPKGWIGVREEEGGGVRESEQRERAAAA